MSSTPAMPGSILYVDDHRDTTTAVSKLLQRAGYEVVSATSYRDAIVHARQRRFDMLISDISLGDGDGKSLLQEIRSLYPIIAIAVSAYAAAQDKHDCIASGYDFFLPKPLVWPAMEKCVRELFQNGASKRQTGTDGSS